MLPVVPEAAKHRGTHHRRTKRVMRPCIAEETRALIQMMKIQNSNLPVPRRDSKSGRQLASPLAPTPRHISAAGRCRILILLGDSESALTPVVRPLLSPRRDQGMAAIFCRALTAPCRAAAAGCESLSECCSQLATSCGNCWRSCCASLCGCCQNACSRCDECVLKLRSS